MFSRREAHVIQLDSRAGSPPTALALLQRHEGADGLLQLGMLLREWEVWGSELLEIHLSYPMLAYYRSQHDDQSWLAALAAVIDCCALVLVGLEGVLPLQGFGADGDACDHCSRGHRGTLVRRLIAELPERLPTDEPSPGSSRWRRLRSRLAPDA